MEYPFENKVLTLVAYSICRGYRVTATLHSFYIDHLFELNHPILTYARNYGDYDRIYVGNYIIQKELNTVSTILTDSYVDSTIVDLSHIPPTAYGVLESGNTFRMCGVYVSHYYDSQYGVNIQHFIDTEDFNEEVSRILSGVKEPYCHLVDTDVYHCPDTIQNSSQLFDCNDKVVISDLDQDKATYYRDKYLKPVYVVSSPEKFCKDYNPVHKELQDSSFLVLSPQFEAVKLMMAEMIGLSTFPLNLVPTFGNYPKYLKTIGDRVIVDFSHTLPLGKAVLNYLRELAPLIEATTSHTIDDDAIQLARETMLKLGDLDDKSASSLVQALRDAINSGTYRFAVPQCDKYKFHGKGVICE